MKYEDYVKPDTNEKWINGQYVGTKQGTPLGDALAPGSDGYDHLRATDWKGSKLQDTLQNEDMNKVQEG